MGTKYASVHIRSDDSQGVNEAFSEKNNVNISPSSDGWVSIYSEELNWSNVRSYGKELSRTFNDPIMTVGYFDDDVIEIHVLHNNKIITSLIAGNGTETYGLKSKRFNVDALNNLLNTNFIKDELTWVLKERDIWQLTDYLQYEFKLAFQGRQETSNIGVPRTPWKLGIPIVKDKGKKVNKSFKVQALIPGSLAAAMITKDKELYTWGDKHYGVLGVNSIKNRYIPEKVLDNVQQASLGSYSAYAIVNGSELWGWGDHSPQKSYVPVHVMNNVKDVGVKSRDVYVLLNNGDLLSYGSTWRHSGFIKLKENVRAMYVSDYIAFAITNDDGLYGFGRNDYGQLGTTTELFSQCLLSNVKQVKARSYTMTAIQRNGDLYVWGSNSLGLIHNEGMEISKPVKVFENVADAVVAQGFIYAITNSGELYAWGTTGATVSEKGSYHQIFPPIKLMENVKQIECDNYQVHVLMNDGQLFCFFIDHEHFAQGYLTKSHCSPIFLHEDESEFAGEQAAIDWFKDRISRIRSTETDFIPLKHMDRVERIVVSRDVVYAITFDEDVYAIGSNKSGLAGIGNRREIRVPTQLKLKI